MIPQGNPRFPRILDRGPIRPCEAPLHGLPRARIRPDGSRRRTKGELKARGKESPRDGGASSRRHRPTMTLNRFTGPPRPVDGKWPPSRQDAPEAPSSSSTMPPERSIGRGKGLEIEPKPGFDVARARGDYLRRVLP